MVQLPTECARRQLVLRPVWPPRDTVVIAPQIQAMMTRWAENRLRERAAL